eukprot:GEMP01013490.1.p1 GENE.GEMP01013490.1~~GEMP01013490.1.p1  ORF type:complete len:632 (+),score=145.07 GEMP01013490.1:476-2371(+)
MWRALVQLACVLWPTVLRPVHGGLLAASKLEKCTDGDKLECDEKLVLTLTLESGQLATEKMEATIDTAETESGTQTLGTPIKVEWSKEMVELRYPLTYIQSVNSQLKEVIVHTSSCSAERDDLSEATCGYWTKKNGAYIDYSEGFCCVCDVFGNSWNGRTTRGKVDCGDVISGWFTQSAHCLRTDALWYSLFEVGPPVTEYEISVFATVGNTTEVISLKHTNVAEQTKIATDTKSPHLYAELVGDLAMAQRPPLYEDKYLLIPATPGHERYNVSGNLLAHAMLIDKSRINLAGTECDKIGVSHYAFKNQPERCLRNVGDCLHHQPNNYHDSDMQRYARGEKMRYMLSNECGGAFALRATRSEQTMKNTYDMRCGISGRHTTLVKLEIAADNLRIVSSLAQGTLINVEVNDFVALSGAGEIVATVNSTTSRAAEFILSVNCSDGVVPGPSPRFSLAPYSMATKVISVHSQSDKATKDLNCTLILKDVTGRVLDTQVRNFSITQLEHECGAQCGNAAKLDGITKVFVKSSNTCPCSWYATWCHILYLKYCWKKLALSILLYGGVPVLAYLTYMGKLGFICRLCKRRKRDVRTLIRRRSTYHTPEKSVGPYADRTRKSVRELRRFSTRSTSSIR